MNDYNLVLMVNVIRLLVFKYEETKDPAYLQSILRTTSQILCNNHQCNEHEEIFEYIHSLHVKNV